MAFLAIRWIVLVSQEVLKPMLSPHQAASCTRATLLRADLGGRVEVRKGKVEDMRLDERVDVLVSEPMGTLLVNERMLETYLYARDHFLKPGGRMFPVRPLTARGNSHTIRL